MNSVYIFADEFKDGEICISADRVDIVQNNHQLTRGITVACAVEGQGRSRFTVTELGSEFIRGTLIEPCTPLSRTSLSLAVAVCRPQTIKKVLEFSATLGVEEVLFFTSDNTQKNYLASKQLRPEFILQNLLKGAEQAWDSELPRVEVGLSLAAILGARHPEYVNVFADLSEDTAGNFSMSDAQRVRLFIGPERGWSQEERQSFHSNESLCLNLGPRYLRVEIACAVGVGRLTAK